MNVWLAAGRYYKGEASPRFYLFVVARSVLGEHWRSLGREVNVASEEFGELVGDLPTDAASPESEIGRAEERAALQRAIEQLPVPFRQTWRLKLKGLDDVQIATVLGVPHNTVRSRLHRGRMRLVAANLESLG